MIIISSGIIIIWRDSSYLAWYIIMCIRVQRSSYCSLFKIQCHILRKHTIAIPFKFRLVEHWIDEIHIFIYAFSILVTTQSLS